ncbi:MAG: hypothetical protein ACYC3L_12570 [Gemmatimonadaceae bacterium]
MSDRRAWLAWLAALSLGGAPRLGAQARGDSIAARVTALSQRVDSLRIALREQEAAELLAGLLPERRVAGLRLRTTARLQPVAAKAIEAAVARARQVIGDDADSVVSGLQLTLQERTSETRQSQAWFNVNSTGPVETVRRVTAADLEVSVEGKSEPGFSFRWPLTGAELQASVLTLVERTGARRVPDPLASWLNRQLPLRAQPDAFWTDLYRALATDDASITRRCTAGDGAACRMAFAVDSLPADRIAAWYDDSDLPKLVGAASNGYVYSQLMHAFSTEEREDCSVNGHVEMCRRMLAALSPDAFGIPVPSPARASLAQLALEVGGAGSLSRMRDASAVSVAAQLAAAARMPIDSLIGRWQQRLMASRPRSPLPGAGFVLASMACVVVCGAWAARSEPWK